MAMLLVAVGWRRSMVLALRSTSVEGTGAISVETLSMSGAARIVVLPVSSSHGREVFWGRRRRR